MNHWPGSHYRTCVQLQKCDSVVLSPLWGSCRPPDLHHPAQDKQTRSQWRRRTDIYSTTLFTSCLCTKGKKKKTTKKKKALSAVVHEPLVAPYQHWWTEMNEWLKASTVHLMSAGDVMYEMSENMIITMMDLSCAPSSRLRADEVWRAVVEPSTLDFTAQHTQNTRPQTCWEKRTCSDEIFFFFWLFNSDSSVAAKSAFTNFISVEEKMTAVRHVQHPCTYEVSCLNYKGYI